MPRFKAIIAANDSQVVAYYTCDNLELWKFKLSNWECSQIIYDAMVVDR